MTTDHADIAFLCLGAPPAVLFAAAYAFAQPWYRSWLGWALFTSAASLACLLTEALLFRLFGWHLLDRTGWLRTILYGFTAAGAWMMLTSLVFVLIHAYHRKEPM